MCREKEYNERKRRKVLDGGDNNANNFFVRKWI